MPSVTKIVGTGSTAARAGSTDTWQNASRVTADDASDADTNGDVDPNGYTNYLVGTMAGNLFAIPTDQRIDGIEMLFEHHMNGIDSGNQVVSSIILLSSIGDGIDLGDNASIVTATPTLRIYGSSTQKHGLALTPAVVNAGALGFKLSIAETSGGNGKRPRIDYMALTVHYSPAPAGLKQTMVI